MGLGRLTVVRPQLLSDDRGSHLIEVAVGAVVMAVAVTGVVAAMSSGMHLVGKSRQRSSAVAVAQEKVERIRSLPYDTVALSADDPADTTDSPEPAHNADPSHPDHDVIDGEAGQPPLYRIADSGRAEPLVIESDGAVRHIDQPVTIGAKTFDAYHYVTWVDDPGFSADKEPALAGDQDYKRVTVVTTWKLAENADTTNSVIESTYVADSEIDAPESTPPPAGTGTPPPAPSPTPGTGCPGDTIAPVGSMQVLSGAGAHEGYTNSRSVQVRGTVTDTCSQVFAQLSNDGVNWTGVATLVNSQPVTVAWTIPPGDGSKTIWGRLRDANGNTSQLASRIVFLDTTPPATPTNLRVVSCALGDSDRALALTWDASSDLPGGPPPTLHGYRLYRSIDSQPFEPVATSGTTSASDTGSHAAGAVRYVVKAYDRSGNESDESNVLSFARGSC